MWRPLRSSPLPCLLNFKKPTSKSHNPELFTTPLSPRVLCAPNAVTMLNFVREKLAVEWQSSCTIFISRHTNPPLSPIINGSCSTANIRRRVLHFFLLPPPAPVAVIFEVDMRSPMYFCKNLLFESSLSCSSLTASMRLKISSKDS